MNLGRGLRRAAYALLAVVWVWGLLLGADKGWPGVVEAAGWMALFSAVYLAFVGVLTWVARGFRSSPQSQRQG